MYKFPFNPTRKKGRFDLQFNIYLCSTFHIQVQLSTLTLVVLTKVQLLFSVSTWTMGEIARLVTIFHCRPNPILKLSTYFANLGHTKPD